MKVSFVVQFFRFHRCHAGVCVSMCVCVCAEKVVKKNNQRKQKELAPNLSGHKRLAKLLLAVANSNALFCPMMQQCNKRTKMCSFLYYWCCCCYCLARGLVCGTRFYSWPRTSWLAGWQTNQHQMLTNASFNDCRNKWLVGGLTDSLVSWHFHVVRYWRKNHWQACGWGLACRTMGNRRQWISSASSRNMKIAIKNMTSPNEICY